MDNSEVAAALEKIADLLDVLGDNPFRIRAYRNAARVIDGLGEPVAKIAEEEPAELAKLPNIGKDLAGKIVEIVKTGSIPLLRELEAKVPAGLVRMMNVGGVGPKRAKLFWDKLDIQSIEALEKAAKEGKLRELKGIGEKLEAKIIQGCAEQATARGRMPIALADERVAPLLTRLRKLKKIVEVDVAGSLRRRRDTIGDIDVLVASNDPGPISEAIVGDPEVREVLASGHTKCSVVLTSGVQVDVRIIEPDVWGAALLYFTGSKAHNIALRSIAIKHGLKLSEYGIFRGEKRLASRTEKEVYAVIGLDYVSPELREDRGEIDAARAHALPELVTSDDLVTDPKKLLEKDAIAVIDHAPGDVSITDRIVQAIERPKTRLISHATGRTAEGREGALLDMPTIVAAAKKRHVMLEIDGDRLDLPDTYARIARDAGVRLVLAGSNIRCALDVARRGWCEKKDIANTFAERELRQAWRAH